MTSVLSYKRHSDSLDLSCSPSCLRDYEAKIPKRRRVFAADTNTERFADEMMVEEPQSEPASCETDEVVIPSESMKETTEGSNQRVYFDERCFSAMDMCDMTCEMYGEETVLDDSPLAGPVQCDPDVEIEDYMYSLYSSVNNGPARVSYGRESCQKSV